MKKIKHTKKNKLWGKLLGCGILNFNVINPLLNIPCEEVEKTIEDNKETLKITQK